MKKEPEYVIMMSKGHTVYCHTWSEVVDIITTRLVHQPQQRPIAIVRTGYPDGMYRKEVA